MKKTKVVIPALGIIAFATAASITGTVAWFTASRTTVVTAGEFTVINTKDNLAVELEGGIGTSVNVSDDHKIDVATTNLLTDGSVDHTNTTKPTIIAPDASGDNVGKIVDYDTETATDLQRGTSTISAVNYTIYTAFTWKMSFTVSFAGSQDKKVGLFMDLSEKTWAHEAVKFTNNETLAADDSRSAAEPVTYYQNADLTGTSVVATRGAQFTGATGTWYKAAPDDTGKAFRIAFIPSSVPANSYGYAKIWAPHQLNNASTNNKCAFVDMDRPAAFESKAYAENDLVYYNNACYKCVNAHTATEWVAANWEAVTLESKTVNLYNSTATTSLTSTTRAAAAAGAGKVVMDNDDASAIPADGAKSSAEALSDCSNYLGYFNPNPNGTVTLTFTCVAYYEGTDENITAEASTIYETMTTSMKFGVSTLKADA